MHKHFSEESFETLDLCCGGKKCPVFRDEGDSIVVEDLEQSAMPIRFAKSDVARVLAWLEARLER